MGMSASIWLVILLALLAANAPFISNRLLLVGKRCTARKPARWHVLELLVMYVAVGMVARALEGRAGQVASQGWEFYAITACLFLTLAAPGFVYRYLFKRR